MTIIYPSVWFSCGPVWRNFWGNGPYPKKPWQLPNTQQVIGCKNYYDTVFSILRQTAVGGPPKIPTPLVAEGSPPRWSKINCDREKNSLALRRELSQGGDGRDLEPVDENAPGTLERRDGTLERRAAEELSVKTLADMFDFRLGEQVFQHHHLFHDLQTNEKAGRRHWTYCNKSHLCSGGWKLKLRQIWKKIICLQLKSTIIHRHTPPGYN